MVIVAGSAVAIVSGSAVAIVSGSAVAIIVGSTVAIIAGSVVASVSGSVVASVARSVVAIAGLLPAHTASTGYNPSMNKLYQHTREGIFLYRHNRFIAHVMLDGEAVVCHVKNTGRCRELLLPEARVVLSRVESATRKTQWDVVAVYKGDMLVNIDSQAPNRAALPWLKDRYPGASIRKEVPAGDSRLDFLVEQDGKKLYVEVKGVTLEVEGLAMFPDAPTPRGSRHLLELRKIAQAGEGAMALFVIQMKQVQAFAPNKEMDPAFAQALLQARQAGVQVLAVDCVVTPEGMRLADEVEVLLP